MGLISSKLHLIKTVYSLIRHPRLGRDKIIEFQNQQLKRIVSHAYDQVPYYRKLFERHGIKPVDIQSVEDLTKIPITSREDLQHIPPEEIVARGVDPRQLIIRKTSGSSGKPLTIRRTWIEERILNLIRYRALRELGLRFRDRRAIVGLVRPLDQHDKQLLNQLLSSMGLYRDKRINCLMTREKIVRQLRDYAPDVVSGLPGVLSEISQNLIDYNYTQIQPRLVFVGGEVITPLMRSQISRALGAPIYDTFASHEFNLIGYECKRGEDYHVCDDSVILEVLKDGSSVSSGERGEIVCTTLHSFAMPFIRYRLGDVVTKGFEKCTCGKPFSTIRSIQGRMIDYFPLPDGRMIHPYEILVPLLLNSAGSWIRQYQLIQKTEDRIVLRVVPFASPETHKLALLEESVKSLLGKGVEFQIVLVPEIKLEPSGKFRVSRSLVKSNYNNFDWDSNSERQLPFNSANTKSE